MISTSQNPILPFLAHQGVMILDGGLATALEARGANLNDELWSARLLLEEPELIQKVHADFLEAGADCIATASYQATLEGFRRKGLSDAQGKEYLRSSATLALAARDQFWSVEENRKGRVRPLVAASVGPYGAFLADGSEYKGDYGLSQAELVDFHLVRWEVLAETDVDLMACETLPDLTEIHALLALLRETPGRWAWLSFSCRDGAHLWDGTPLREAARLCDGEEAVAAVGVNCVPPELVSDLIAELRAGTTKPLLVYPNSGEVWDGKEKVWRSSPTPGMWETTPGAWVAGGCSGVGGCCRVGRETIRGLRNTLANEVESGKG